jgi:DNA-binding response OmpR family regulator
MVSGSLAGKKILVVEDEFLVAELLCARLAVAGAILVAPTDRSEVALDFIATERVDGAVLDFMLVDGTCLVVARKLEAQGVPFLMVSGLPLGELPTELRNAPYLGKPIHPVEFIELATRTFGGQPALGA